MKKSTYIGIFIILLLMVLVLGIFAFTGNIKKTNSTMNQNVVNKEELKQNEQANEQIDEVVNNELENSMQEEIQNAEENIISTETFKESPKTAEEKALELVKNDWGEDAQVQFLAEGIDANGNYIITIRNSQTTEAKAFYSVNINNGTFTKKEMN